MDRHFAFILLLVWVLSAPARSQEPTQAPQPFIDAAPPSQALRTDRARPAVRFVVSLVLRAPFDRSYGVGLAFIANRHFEVGSVVALREDRSLELGASVLVRPFRGRGNAVLARSTLSAIVVADGGQVPLGARVDSGIGYGSLLDGVYLEILGGTSYRTSRALEQAPWALYLSARIGFGF